MAELHIDMKEPYFRKLYELSKLASKSNHEIRIVKGTADVDAKSVLGLISLGLREGDLVTFKSEDDNLLKQVYEFVIGSEHRKEEYYYV